MRFYTCYNLAVFEEEKLHNDNRFTASVVTYMLSQMFRSPDAPKVTYESHAKDLGIIPPKRKAVISKKVEVAKSNQVMDKFLNNSNWG